MIDKPLYQNPLGGGLMKDGILQPMRMDDQGQNPELINPRPPTSGGFVTDMRDRTLQDPYSIGGAGALGLARNDGSYTGAMFLNDESRPRSEEDIRNRYEQARAQAAESRRKGFLGQVVLPGEQSFDQFKEFSGNSFFLKRNPNIPESAYSNFDLTDVGGFDNPTMDSTETATVTGANLPDLPPMFATPGLPPPEAPSPDTIVSPLQTVQGPEDTFNPYNRVGQQLMGPNQDDILGTLKNIEQGIASLGQGGMNKSSFGGFNNNFGIGSFFPPYGGMYG